MDREDHDLMGASLREHDFRAGGSQSLRHPLPAWCCGSRILPWYDLVPHLLVSRIGSSEHNWRFHGRNLAIERSRHSSVCRTSRRGGIWFAWLAIPVSDRGNSSGRAWICGLQILTDKPHDAERFSPAERQLVSNQIAADAARGVERHSLAAGLVSLKVVALGLIYFGIVIGVYGL